MSTVVKGDLSQAGELVDRAYASSDEFDPAKQYEVQTDKKLVKVRPCQFCRRALVVSTFYVEAWLKCSPCSGKAATSREPGSVAVAQAGRTEPMLARDLTEVLINQSFAAATCPVGGDEHRMELKSVSHHERYGPGEWVDGKNGREWRQNAPGETVLHQCLDCRATVTYSTTAQMQFRRINEPTGHKHVNGWATTLGARSDD